MTNPDLAHTIRGPNTSYPYTMAYGRWAGARNRSTKLLRVELCIGIRVACILNAYSCAYAIQAATGQVVWPRLDSCMPCTCICHACRYRAVTRATWRHAPVHAHVHEQCSSSLRGLDICISRKRDITYFQSFVIAPLLSGSVIRGPAGKSDEVRTTV